MYKEAYSTIAEPGMVAHTFSPSTWEAEQADLWEFEASLLYIARSRSARGT